MELRLPLSPPQIIDGITLKFPAKLWRIVNGCKSGAISWGPGGKSIKIHRKQFEHDYLSSAVYFKTTNFPSFVRQLNIYGFRKVPTANRWQENGNIFEYKHDFFVKGHPELLSEVRRNIAVRRTQREIAFKDNEDALTQSQAKFRDILKRAKESGPKEDRFNEKSYHPLLKSQAIMRYHEPLQQKEGNITTVYMNPRGAACDMQTISPSRLQDQVLGLLPSINGSDDDEENLYKRTEMQASKTLSYDDISIENSVDKLSLGLSHSMSESKMLKNPILFLPSAAGGDCGLDLTSLDGISTQKLSQDDCYSVNKQLMFGGPICKDEELYDLEKTLSSSFELPDECTFSVERMDSKVMNNTCPTELNSTSAEEDSMCQSLTALGESLGDEQGYLMPAYFDPSTGTVAFLFPTLSAET